MRRLTSPLATLAAAALAATALNLVPAASAAAGAKPGPAGPALVLESDAEFSGYDVAVDGNGDGLRRLDLHTTTNVLRRVHLCVLPPGATACAGGVKTILPLGGAAGESSASGLQVVTAPGAGATLVWFHDTPDSINQPYGGQLATAVAGPDGSLSAATDRVAAPSFGSLKTATVSPSGQLWAVAQASTATPNQLYVYTDFAAPAPVTAPFFVNEARLAFSGLVRRAGGGPLRPGQRADRLLRSAPTAPGRVPHRRQHLERGRLRDDCHRLGDPAGRQRGERQLPAGGGEVRRYLVRQGQAHR